MMSYYLPSLSKNTPPKAFAVAKAFGGVFFDKLANPLPQHCGRGFVQHVFPFGNNAQIQPCKVVKSANRRKAGGVL